MKNTCTTIWPRLLLLALLSGLSGCGAKAYEERLELTKQYYDYVERLNRNLGTTFNGSGVTMRTPTQFQLIPPPARKPPKPAAEGEEEATEEIADESQRDPRLPEHLNFTLPGLLSVWEASLDTVEAGSAVGNSKGYLYLLGNYEAWSKFKTAQEIGDPVKYYDDLIRAFSTGLQISIDQRARANAANMWHSVFVPETKDELFTDKKEFTSIVLVPETPPATEESAPVPPAREYQVYLYANGDMKIALVYDLPRNVSAGESLQDRIPLSLQTVSVSSEKPRISRAATNAGNAGGPAGAGAPPPSQPAGANF